MVRASDILKRLVLTTIQAADLQRRRLTDLSAKDFPAKHSKIFINALLEFNNEILKIMRQKLVDFEQISDEDDFENLHDDIIQYVQLLWHLNYISHIVERSDREHVGESTVLLLSELTKKFSDSEFFVIPTYQYNYIYQNLQKFLLKISAMLPNTRGVFTKLPNKLAVLSFPDVYRDNLIANSELAHEIGHFIDDLDGVTSKIKKQTKIDQDKLKSHLNKELDTEKLGFLAIEKIKAKRIEQIE